MNNYVKNKIISASLDKLAVAKKTPATLLFPEKYLNNQHIQEAIISKAKKLLNTKPFSVTEKSVYLVPGMNSHDYQSIMIYSWPDQNNPCAPYIMKDGEINPNTQVPELNDEKRLYRMTDAVEQLSLAYHLTQNEVYAEKTKELLATWFVNPETKMNPHLNYAQMTPHKNIGTNWGIIESRNLIKVVTALEILKESPSFTHEFQNNVKEWFRNFLDWLTFNNFGQEEKKAKNNHGVWYDAQALAFNFLLGNFEAAKKILREVCSSRINTQIEPNGKMPAELKRTRSKHYTEFNLQAFIIIATFGDLLGINLWDYKGYNGESIKKALDFFLTYYHTKTPWPYQEISNKKEDEFIKYIYLADQHFPNKKYEAIAKEALEATKK
ncbi:MAG: alginate lyase family protein [Candidatus Margulisiibacteriota bacterium]|jgi:hypothetical protein